MKYLGIAFCVFIALFLIWCFLYGFIKTNSDPDENSDNAGTDNDFPPCEEIASQHVTVVGQTCSAKVVGIKKPKAVNEFLIYFKNDNKETFSVSVPQELYDGFEEGQTGTLSLVNGKLYGFELD